MEKNWHIFSSFGYLIPCFLLFLGVFQHKCYSQLTCCHCVFGVILHKKCHFLFSVTQLTQTHRDIRIMHAFFPCPLIHFNCESFFLPHVDASLVMWHFLWQNRNGKTQPWKRNARIVHDCVIGVCGVDSYEMKYGELMWQNLMNRN